MEDIALSTNGVKLPALAGELADAGLDRVNISADSLRPERIVAIAPAPTANVSKKPRRFVVSLEWFNCIKFNFSMKEN